MLGKMAIAAASPGYNDLGRSVTSTFLSRLRQILFTIISTVTLSKNEQKINVGS